MKLPYFQLFPSDWLGDARIRSLSYEEKGIWMELRCWLHQMDNRGILILGGEVLKADRLANMLNLLEQNSSKVLSKCLSLGLLKVDPETGAYFSEEVVETERIRKIRSDVGKIGGDNRLLKQNSKQTPKQTVEYGTGTGNGTDSEKGECRGGAPTLQELLTVCQMRGVRQEVGEAFWNSMEGCGWVDRAQRPVLNYEPLLKNFSITWEENRQKDKLHANRNHATIKTNPRNAGLAGDQAKRTAAVVARVAAMQQKNSSVATKQPTNGLAKT